MPNLFEHLIGQEGRKGGRPLGPTTRAETPLLTTCRHKKLVATVRAPDTGKARLKSAAVKVGVDDIINEDPPEAVAPLEPLLPHTFDLVVHCLDQAVQGRFLRLAGSIKADGAFCDQGKLLPVSQRGGSVQNLSNPGESQAAWPRIRPPPSGPQSRTRCSFKDALARTSHSHTQDAKIYTLEGGNLETEARF